MVSHLWKRGTVTLFTTLCLAIPSFGQESGLPKVTDDVSTKYTSVGNIGLTITNYGTIGNRLITWPTQPSCEYPRGSKIEHIYQGGLWVGGMRNGLLHVSTAASDRVTRSTSQGLIDGYEFTSAIGDTITELSTLTDNRPPNSQFSTSAISHQDFICDYVDTNRRVPGAGDSIINHEPLGIKVHQETYAWNFPFTDYFVILRYQIINVSADTLDSLYVGFWNNSVVRNTNYVRPGTPGYFDYTGQGFTDTARMAYSFDYSGAPGGPPADSYFGLKLLGTTPFPVGVTALDSLKSNTFYNAWGYRISDPNADWLASPTDDENSDPRFSRYSRMTTSMPKSFIDALRLTPRNVTYLLSTGPFRRLNPHDTLEVVFGAVCAKKAGTSAARFDSLTQRKNLYSNASWAQKSYNGSVIDGQLVRYSLPKPPRSPKARVEVQNQSCVLYWDKSTSEESIDPISAQKDFEGYRIYRTAPGADFLNHDNFLLDIPIVGDFDKYDGLGYNTGFSRILLSQPKTFPGDSVQYWYRFPPAGDTTQQLNGWQYLLGVSAYDQGDSANGVPSLESAKSLFRAIPGTMPVEDKSTSVGVYPNPYYANAHWDGGQERQRKIYFYNLPSRCEIRIYTLAGDVVAVLDHDASSDNGQGIEWFSTFGDPGTTPQFAGGEHAWDLVTRYDQAIATGLYLFTVENKATHDVKRGKFMIIK
jgi:hypothetical protein